MTGSGIIYAPKSILYDGNFDKGKANGKGRIEFIQENWSYVGNF